ncbi:MAG: aldehyde ferredoxin oxidoreductase family protein [bacterium]
MQKKPLQNLDIDLTTGTHRLSPLPTDITSGNLGGRGYNVAYLYANLAADVGALDPENILMFSAGLLTGGPAPASARVHVNARSPLTGILGSSNIGGNIGRAFRGAGLQTIIIRGRAAAPQYLFIDGSTIHLRDAGDLWGKDTWQTQDLLEARYKDQDLQILTIGPAGENRTRFACIISDKDHAAGRTGMGAVMGSKNLKAIVIKNRPSPASSLDVPAREAIRQYVRAIRTSPEFQTFAEYGGAGYIKWADDLGILATRNYRQNRFEAIDRIDGKKLREKLVRSRGCRGCPVHCKAQLNLAPEEQPPTFSVRPEFESMVNLGSKCGLEDLDTLVKIDNLCTRLGLDVISAGNAIAFAMDLSQRGILSPESAAGLDLSWGNGETMLTLLEQMTTRTGLGAILSLGVRRAAELIGNGADLHAPHVKGLELAAYHPYNIMGTALGYAVSNRGGDFSNIYASMEYTWSPEKSQLEFGTVTSVEISAIYGKAQLVKRAMLVNVALDCIGLCKVPVLSLLGKFDLVDEAVLVTTLTGQPVSAAELLHIGERVSNLERLFNLKFGVRTEDDRLPQMFFNPEVLSSGQPAKAPDWMEFMIKKFYEEMGWCAEGRPTLQKLLQLDIPAPGGLGQFPEKTG